MFSILLILGFGTPGPFEAESQCVLALCSSHKDAKPWRYISALETEMANHPYFDEWRKNMLFRVQLHLERRYGISYDWYRDVQLSTVVFHVVGTEGQINNQPPFGMW